MQEYSEMLLDSAKKVSDIIKNPKCTDENKVIIAAANTLAQTTKSAIQIELLELRKNNTSNNINVLIDKIGD